MAHNFVENYVYSSMYCLYIFVVSLVFFAFCIPVPQSYAEELFTVRPLVLDFKLNPGGASDLVISLKNLAPRRFTSVYVFVKDVKNTEDYNNKSSLSSWIEIPRYIELKPGEDKEVKLRVNVNRLAETGKYSGEVAFIEAMDEAGARRLIDSAKKISVNAEVYNDLRERLQINSFLPNKNFYFGFPATLSYEIENTGDTDINYKGKILVYDDSGSMVEDVPIGGEGVLLRPREKKVGEFIPSESIGAGNFKASLSLSYASTSVDEETSFAILSWKKISLIFLVSISLLLIMVNFSYKIYERSSD
jgi:uncharacterized membrane protein